MIKLPQVSSSLPPTPTLNEERVAPALFDSELAISRHPLSDALDGGLGCGGRSGGPLALPGNMVRVVRSTGVVGIARCHSDTNQDILI